MARHLTNTEILLLKPVFKNTLEYGAIRCDINTADIGGVGNSITPAGTTYFSKLHYCSDFSKAGAWAQWLFVHEMMHVWQWGHHIWPVNQAICLFITQGGDYRRAYPYDLRPGKNLIDYNIEQQASIIADYWALLTRKLRPQDNNNTQTTLNDYAELIAQLNSSGPSIRKLDQIPI